MQAKTRSALTAATIRRLVGEKVYERGQSYFNEGHVTSFEGTSTGVRAVVHGNQDYVVALAHQNGDLQHACNCPMGADGAFCKHCVAVGLAWLAGDGLPSTSKRRAKAKELTLADAAKILNSQDKEALVQLVIEWAKDDTHLRERILLHAARRCGPETAVAAVRRAFAKAARVGGFVDYRRASSWARGVADAIDNIEQLLNDGRASEVVETCEWALRLLVRAAGSIDDSDGHFTMLRDRLEEIHLRACEEARPEPVALATRLLGAELESDCEVFFGAAKRYAEILGNKGLEQYRRLAEVEWKKVPQRTAKDGNSQWGEHFRITHVMQSLARAADDIEELVAVMSRDLSHAYNYLQIAEVYRGAHQHELALAWAKKGLEAFPERTDSRLRVFAADEYHAEGRHVRAMELVWADFLERPGAASYVILERHAQKAGTWPEWRRRALAEIGGRIAKAKQEKGKKAVFSWSRPDYDHSPLVQIFLHEGDSAAAWREAHEGGCSDGLWLRLAAEREAEHAGDAADIYLKQAEISIDAVRNGRYDESVELLIKAARAMKRVNKTDEFVRKLEALRSKYKIKRNFVKLLEENRNALDVA